jgi:flagellar secretion chaperone FliS
MYAEEYARRYTEAQVGGVDRERLLLLVLEGGMKHLRLTRDALAAGDTARFAEHLGRSQAIVSELLGTLDHDAGGEIAANLARLYEFMLFHLTEANGRRSVQHVDEVMAVFAIVQDAFRTALEAPHAAASPPPGANG